MIIRKLLERDDLEDRALAGILELINHNPERVPNHSEIIKKVMFHPNSEEFAFMELPSLLYNEKIKINDLEQVFEELLKRHPKFKTSIGRYISSSKLEDAGKRRLLRKIYKDQNLSQLSFTEKIKILKLGGFDKGKVTDFFNEIKGKVKYRFTK